MLETIEQGQVAIARERLDDGAAGACPLGLERARATPCAEPPSVAQRLQLGDEVLDEDVEVAGRAERATEPARAPPAEASTSVGSSSGSPTLRNARSRRVATRI